MAGVPREDAAVSLLSKTAQAADTSPCLVRSGARRRRASLAGVHRVTSHLLCGGHPEPRTYMSTERVALIREIRPGKFDLMHLPAAGCIRMVPRLVMCEYGRSPGCCS